MKSWDNKMAGHKLDDCKAIFITSKPALRTAPSLLEAGQSQPSSTLSLRKYGAELSFRLLYTLP
jgi:hypothetical protein